MSSAAAPSVHQLSASLGDGDPPPAKYLQPPPHNPSALRPPPLSVPAVDLALLGRSAAETAKLDAALRGPGFFHAVNHGVPPSLLSRLLAATREFFRDPPPPHVAAGYQGYGADADVAKEQVLDWSDRIYLQVRPVAERRAELWPASMRAVIEEYDVRCGEVAERVLEGAGEALGLGGRHFAEACGEGGMMVFKRFNMYPRCGRPEAVMGLKPHKDASAITVVLQDPEVDGGLQALDAAGDWGEVPMVPGALLVNVGDQLEIMSNGIYKSPMHRVVINAEKERVSVVSFYSMRNEMEIGPAGALVGEGRPRMYKNITVEEYLKNFYRVFPTGETAIDSVKIPRD